MLREEIRVFLYLTRYAHVLIFRPVGHHALGRLIDGGDFEFAPI